MEKFGSSESKPNRSSSGEGPSAQPPRPPTEAVQAALGSAAVQSASR